MTLGFTILTGIFYLVPGMIEMVYNSSLNSNKISSRFLYLEITKKRDFLYISIIITFISLIGPFKFLRIFSEGLLGVSLFSYFSTIRKCAPLLLS